MVAALCDSVQQGSSLCSLAARAEDGRCRTGFRRGYPMVGLAGTAKFVPVFARERCAALRRSLSSSNVEQAQISSSQAIAGTTVSTWNFVTGSKRVSLCMLPVGSSFGVGVPTRQRLLVLVAKASQSGQPEGEEDDDDAGEQTGTDWDRAWSAFRNELKSRTSLPDMESYVSRRPPSQRLQKPPPFAKQSKSRQRQKDGDEFQAERWALGAWTDEKFTIVGFGILFAVFIYMVVIIGPPPPH